MRNLAISSDARGDRIYMEEYYEGIINNSKQFPKGIYAIYIKLKDGMIEGVHIFDEGSCGSKIETNKIEFKKIDPSRYNRITERLEEKLKSQ